MTDRTVEELVRDPVVLEALRRIGSSKRPQRCPRCHHGIINPNSKHGFCQPCETEHEERIRASRRRSYHRRKGLPTLAEDGRTSPNTEEGVLVGEAGWRLLTVQEAAEILGVTTRTVETWIASGKLRSLKLAKKVRRIPADAIVDLIDRAEGQTNA